MKCWTAAHHTRPIIPGKTNKRKHTHTRTHNKNIQPTAVLQKLPILVTPHTHIREVLEATKKIMVPSDFVARKDPPPSLRVNLACCHPTGRPSVCHRRHEGNANNTDKNNYFRSTTTTTTYDMHQFTTETSPGSLDRPQSCS